MNSSSRDSIYDRKSLEKFLEILSQGLENLDENKLRLLERALPEIIQEIPSITKTEIEKKKLLETLKQIIQDYSTK